MSQVQIITIAKKDDGMRLDRWFKQHVPQMTHVALQKALRKGQVRLDGKRAKASDRVEAGQEVRVPPVSDKVDEKRQHIAPKKPTKALLEQLKQSIVFENRHIAVINKPQGVAVQGGTGQQQSVDLALPYMFEKSDEPPKLVHRIDRDTTGLLVVAKNRKTAVELTEGFRTKAIKKRYVALVVGVPSPREGTISLPLAKGRGVKGQEKMHVNHEEGQKAISHFRVLDYVHKKVALVELEPETGRTHQLRVHMAAIGHPILGDGKYGGKMAFLEAAGNTLHLHAWQLILPKAVLAQKQPLEAELPDHMKQSMAFLGLYL